LTPPEIEPGIAATVLTEIPRHGHIGGEVNGTHGFGVENPKKINHLEENI